MFQDVPIIWFSLNASVAHNIVLTFLSELQPVFGIGKPYQREQGDGKRVNADRLN